jgi:hypothetical protein
VIGTGVREFVISALNNKKDVLKLRSMYPAWEYVMPYVACFLVNVGGHPEFFLGGWGADIESVCNLCLVLKSML